MERLTEWFEEDGKKGILVKEVPGESLKTLYQKYGNQEDYSDCDEGYYGMAILKKYEDTGLAPEQIREMDRLYEEKCRELAEFRKKLQQDWIPVSERLPETEKTVIVTVHSSEWISDYNSDWVPEQEKNHHPESYTVYAGRLGEDGKWRFCDEYMCETLCEKAFRNDKGRSYDVVIAWMQLPEPYKTNDN